MRRQLIGSLLLLTATAVAAEAQVRRERPRPDSATVTLRGPDGRGFGYMFGPGDVRIDLRRGRLGVVVMLAPDAARDSVGAHIEAVTPGGAADRAGVRSGDMILRLNGNRLAVTDPADRDDFESRPGRRLINLASRLEPGDTVRLEVRRDNRSQTFTFQAGQSDMDAIVERLRIPGGIREFAPGMTPFGRDEEENGRVRVFSYMGGGPSQLELVNVNPALANGLGISEGLLVVDIGGQDTLLGIRTGDVILTIGGRRPTSPSHAMRILSTYNEDEPISIEVMRQRRRQTVTGRLPRAAVRWRNFQNRFETPTPGMRLEIEPHEMMRRMLELDSERTRPRIRIAGDEVPREELLRKVETDL